MCIRDRSSTYREKSLFKMRPFFAFRQKAFSYRGVYRVPLFNLSVCVSVSLYVTFVVFTDRESCSRPISTDPGSMEAG